MAGAHCKCDWNWARERGGQIRTPHRLDQGQARLGSRAGMTWTPIPMTWVECRLTGPWRRCNPGRGKVGQPGEERLRLPGVVDATSRVVSRGGACSGGDAGGEQTRESKFAAYEFQVWVSQFGIRDLGKGESPRRWKGKGG